MKDDKVDYQREFTREHLPLYQSLSPRICELLGSVLSDAEIPVAQIEHRPKSVESFLAKLGRKAYSDPFKEIKDFAGIRVIAYYADDVPRVAQILRDEFEIDEANSTDKLEELQVDEFGYRSYHLVCSLKPPRSKLTEWRQYNDLCFEVQIRSVLQHAWAAISHKLDYKSAKQAPKEVRRQLFRLSALLELGDQEFASIRDRSRTVVEEYREDVDRGQLDIPLNVASLTEYLNERFDRDEWRQLGIAAGMRDPGGTSPSDIHTRLLFETLSEMGIGSLKELDTLIAQNKRRAPEILTSIVEACEIEGSKVSALPENLLNFFVAIAARERLPVNFTWGERWDPFLRDAMNELLQKPRKRSKKKAQQEAEGDAEDRAP
ncbi:MAG: hypothetical protein IH977_11905 [Nitrospinae bacterium]|nr:hypothetical protein [Nitrospinota bacterium]